MPIRVAIPKEQTPGERRVAMVPEVAKRLIKMGLEVCIEKGLGDNAFFPDDMYEGATVVESADELYQTADVLLRVQGPGEAAIKQMKPGAVLIAMMSPSKYPKRALRLQEGKVTCFSMELLPRITRAQSMDVLSSQASIAGYKAVLMGADLASVFFPMLTTAAGTIRPAKVLVLGAGVAGLQAIATAKRLGAMVEAYDVRSATKEQCESLGAKFIDTGVKAEGAGGYARELTDAEKQQQQDVLAKHIAASAVVITTAALPGRASPKLIFKDMVDAMKPGAVIVDLAAEGGGNCELSESGKTIKTDNGVTIHAPLNVTSQMPVHASEMYAKNLLNFMTPMIKDGELVLDWNDEVLAGAVLTHDGEIKHAPTRELVASA